MTGKSFLPALAALLMLGSSAGAAEQGVLGATSKGGIAITVSVAAHVAFSDVKTTAASTAGDHTACLWLGTATRGYAITPSGAPILWKSSAASTVARTVDPETKLADLSSTATRPDCNKDPSLFVGYEAATMTARPATLLIAPE